MQLTVTESKAGLALPMLALAGCAPVVNIAGADFPAWMLCVIVGGGLTALLRPLFAALRIEPYMGPLPLVYLSLVVLIASVTWLIFFNRI